MYFLTMRTRWTDVQNYEGPNEQINERTQVGNEGGKNN